MGLLGLSMLTRTEVLDRAEPSWTKLPWESQDGLVLIET